MKGANILTGVFYRMTRNITISLSSSLKLSRLPPPDLRITCTVKSVPNHENLEVHQKQNLGERDRRRNNRLARAITPPTVIAARNGHTPSSFDFFETRKEKRCCFALSSRQNILLTNRAWRSCLSEFDLPGAGSLLGGTRPSNETGAMMEQIMLEKYIATHTIFAAHVSCHFLISCAASRNELGHFEGITLPDRSMSPLAASLKNVGLWLSFYLTIQLIS